MVRFFLLIGFCLSCFIELKAFSNNSNSFYDETIIQAADTFSSSSDSLVVTKVKFKRGKAILFTVMTGFLGGHRIYLGTHHRTPIIYSLTFGGVGILSFIDLIHLVFTKDISIYEDKSQIIMWKK